MDGQTRRDVQKRPRAPARCTRFFRHLRHPARGRGSSIVDETLAAHRSEMMAVIREAQRRSRRG
jgi:hypothetical protein